MKNEEKQTAKDRLKSYKLGFQLDDSQTEMSLLEAIDSLENEELKTLLYVSGDNASRFTWRLTKALETKSTCYIRHNPGYEMDDEMKTEVLEGVKEIYESRPK